MRRIQNQQSLASLAIDLWARAATVRSKRCVGVSGGSDRPPRAPCAQLACFVLLVSYWTLATCCGQNPTPTALARHKRGWFAKARLPANYCPQWGRALRRERLSNPLITPCHTEGKNRRPRDQTTRPHHAEPAKDTNAAAAKPKNRSLRDPHARGRPERSGPPPHVGLGTRRDTNQ